MSGSGVDGRGVLCLFIPADYDPGTRYPLALFMADGSTTGKGTVAPLNQGYGGIIWATPESQAEHPCLVLVPPYVGPENVVNDVWETSEDEEAAILLLLAENLRINFVQLEAGTVRISPRINPACRT